MGDASFQKKCLGKMKDVSGKQGRTVLFVSHNMAAVKTLCNRAVYLDNGKVQKVGFCEQIVEDYLIVGVDSSTKKEWRNKNTRPGNENISLNFVKISPPIGQAIVTVDTGAILDVGFECHINGINLDVTAQIRNAEDLFLFESGIIINPNGQCRIGEYSVRAEIPGHLLNAGYYTVTILFGQDQKHVLFRRDRIVSFSIEHTATGRGANLNQAPGLIRPQINWQIM